MPLRDRIVDHAERLRAGLAGLGCSRSEALALTVLLAGSLAALALLWSIARAHDAGLGDAALAPPEPAPGPAATADAGPSPEAGPVVHVSGQVARAGVYDLPPGGRVADALEAAGGPLPEAHLDGLNLARVVADGEQIHVPAPGEEPIAAGGRPAGGAWLPDGRLDVNRATAAELEELPGNGPVLAR